jgi:CheY-like chemotaxis protein
MDQKSNSLDNNNPTNTAEQKTETPKQKILVVEDDAFLREIYVDTLNRGGYAVDTAADGDEGFAKIKQGGYDLILLDIILPKQEGIQIMRTLKSDPSYTSTTPIVFLTNLDNDSEIKQALQLGKGYLIKSQLTPADLLREVKLYLGKS